MHLVHDEVFLGRHLPRIDGAPLGFARIDDVGFVFPGAHGASARVASAEAIDVELVGIAGLGAPAFQHPVAGAVGVALEGIGLPTVEVAADADLGGVGGPDAEGDEAGAAGALDSSAERAVIGLAGRGTDAGEGQQGQACGQKADGPGVTHGGGEDSGGRVGGQGRKTLHRAGGSGPEK